MHEDRLVAPAVQRLRNHFQGTLLVGLQGERLGPFETGGLLVLNRSLHALMRRADHPLAPQQRDRRLRATGPPGKFPRRQRPAGCAQRLDHCGLFLGQTQLGQMCQRVRIQAQQRGQSGAGLAAHCRGQHCLQHRGPRTQVAPGQPLGQSQHRRRQQHALVEYFVDRFEPPAGLSTRDQPHAVAFGQPVTASERHAHPTARLHLSTQFFRNQVIERPVRSSGNHHRGHQAPRPVAVLLR